MAGVKLSGVITLLLLLRCVLGSMSKAAEAAAVTAKESNFPKKTSSAMFLLLLPNMNMNMNIARKKGWQETAAVVGRARGSEMGGHEATIQEMPDEMSGHKHGHGHGHGNGHGHGHGHGSVMIWPMRNESEAMGGVIDAAISGSRDCKYDDKHKHKHKHKHGKDKAKAAPCKGNCVEQGEEEEEEEGEEEEEECRHDAPAMTCLINKTKQAISFLYKESSSSSSSRRSEAAQICPPSCFRPNPVCGTDGVTYWCGLPDAECAGVEVDHLGFCDFGSKGTGSRGVLAVQSLLLVHMIWLMLAACLVLLGFP